MSALVSAKNLLLQYDPNCATDEKGEKYRGTAYEFQDYAYRLANRLNDLEHLPIYMKLVKKYPRAILEQVYQYIADVDQYNKGALFMWKFKQIRDEIQLKRDMQNYNYEFVVKKMKKVRDKLAKKIIKKYNNFDNNSFVQFLANLDIIKNSSSINVLIVGNTNTLLPSTLLASNNKVYAIEISRLLSKEIKQEIGSKKFKAICKDFLDNTYNDREFDIVIIQDLWQIVPLEKELDYLNEIKRVIKPKGSLIFNSKTKEQPDQSWNQFKGSFDDQFFYFEKVNSPLQIESVLEHSSFKLKHCLNLQNKYFGVCSLV